MRTIKFPLLLCLLLLSLTMGGCNTMPDTKTLHYEDFPARPVKLIVPFGGGGGKDLQARAMQAFAGQYLGRPFTVYNRLGAGGSIALNETLRAKPDGYTLGVACPEILLHSIYNTTNYRYHIGLDPLAQISSMPMLLVISADQPWNSVSELVEYGKRPGNYVKFAHSGLGAVSHILGEIFAKATGIEAVHVPFYGASETITTLLGNHVQATFVSTSAVKKYLQNGQLKVLATTGSKRIDLPLLAGVPTLEELGIPIEFLDWTGVAAPQMLPPEIKAKLAEALRQMALDPRFQAALRELDLQPDYLSPQECQEKWAMEKQTLTKLVTETGVLEQIKRLRGE